MFRRVWLEIMVSEHLEAVTEAQGAKGHSRRAAAVEQRQAKSRPRRSPHTGDPLAVTVDDAKHITGLGHTKIYELIRDGTLQSVAIGKRRLILHASIRALLTPPT
jgi:excisionase family DNA binding protein